MTVIFMAQRFRSRPSDLLQITDGFAAYCFDEVCCYILSQIDEGKRPFFRRTQNLYGNFTANSRTVEILQNLGAEVKRFD